MLSTLNGNVCLPRCSRLAISALLCLILCRSLLGQAVERICGKAGRRIALEIFDDPKAYVLLKYDFSNPQAFSRASIEIWDRPNLLLRTPIPLQAEGKFVWDPKQEPPSTPNTLAVAIFDPDRPGDTGDSRVLLGSAHASNEDPELFPQTVILQEGSRWPEVTLEGTELSRNTHVRLSEQEGEIFVLREYLPATLDDLHHLRVQIPSGYLEKPTILALSATTLDDNSLSVGSVFGGEVIIHVMSKDRPVLSSIEPAEVSGDDAEGKTITLRILGRGFTNTSQLLTGFQHGIENTVTGVAISPNEFQVRFAPPLPLLSFRRNDHEVRFWVRNGDDMHVSDPVSLRLLPTTEFPVKRPLPSIKGASPYPVELMDQRSPAFMPLTIYGENFRPDDVVVVQERDEEGRSSDVKLRTEFVSSQELHAWLPRDLWRHHRLSYRLVTETSSGHCAVEAWDYE